MGRESLDHRNDTSATLGNLIKAKREASGFSQSQFAAKASLSRTYLSRLERGQYAHPSIVILARLAEVLNVKYEDLCALAGYVAPDELPSFGTYLELMHPEWPEAGRIGLVEYHDYLKHKYSQNNG